MELKHSRGATEQMERRVLIAPLWNWNSQDASNNIISKQVLIAPLWNWNKKTKKELKAEETGSNRTFMELKHAKSDGKEQKRKF